MTLLTTAFAQGLAAARPAAAASNKGYYYLETDTNGGTLYQSTGVAWVQLAAGVSAAGASPLTTKGDLFGYSTLDARVPVGSDGQVLTADAAQALGLKWAAANPLTTKGDILGYSTLAARVPIGADATVLTADSTQALGLKWAAAAGGGALTQLYTNTLGANTATIDTGVGGIAQTNKHLLIFAMLRSALAATDSDPIHVRLNGHGATYGWQKMTVNNAASSFNGQTDGQIIAGDMPAANATANVFGVMMGFIPNYAVASFMKPCLFMHGRWVTGNGGVGVTVGWYLGAAEAISQFMVKPNSGNNLLAGSSLTIYGLN